MATSVGAERDVEGLFSPCFTPFSHVSYGAVTASPALAFTVAAVNYRRGEFLEGI
jgi:hypothetical protein